VANPGVRLCAAHCCAALLRCADVSCTLVCCAGGEWRAAGGPCDAGAMQEAGLIYNLGERVVRGRPYAVSYGALPGRCWGILPTWSLKYPTFCNAYIYISYTRLSPHIEWKVRMRCLLTPRPRPPARVVTVVIT
jgi:hypothetical protein